MEYYISLFTEFLLKNNQYQGNFGGTEVLQGLRGTRRIAMHVVLSSSSFLSLFKNAIYLPLLMQQSVGGFSG